MQWVYLILIVIAGFALMTVISQLLLKRAIVQVLKTMKKHNATSSKTAMLDSDMKLKPRTYWQSLGRLRDYKPQALLLLESLNIVNRTEDDKLYISEDELAKSRWKNI